MFYKIIFLLAIYFSNTYCQNDKSSSTANPTNAPTTPLVPTDTICKTCKCSDDFVDCDSKEINTFFTEADWLGVQSMKPKRVSMRLNTFTNVTSFPELPIQHLDLSHGAIKYLKRACFKYLQNMIWLDLSHNNLTSETLQPNIFEGIYLPESFEPLKSMRTLNLSNNQLHSINADLFMHLAQLEELSLQGNPMKVLDHVSVIAISSLSNLKVLNLKNCQLKDIPETFLHTPIHLEWLDLSRNELQVVPNPLEEARSLKYLSLSFNPIKIIEVNSTTYKPFPNIPTLVELHLSHMPFLEYVGEEAMGGLEGLKVLHMNHNPALSDIHPSAFVKHDPEGEGKITPLIEKIYLDHNKLSSIPSILVGRWDLATLIDIQENPYLCDCTNQWMVDNLIDLIIKNTGINYTSDIICHEPIEMRGKSLVHLRDIHNGMRCVDKYNDRPERDAAILIGTFIGVFITIPVVLGILLLHKRGYFAACGLGGPAAFSRAFYKRTGTEEFM